MRLSKIPRIHYFPRMLVAAVLAFMACSAGAADIPEPVVERFEIVRFEVEGNTLFSPQTIDNLLAPFTGIRRDFGHVQRAIEALEGAYRQRGFNVVQVVLPEQELNQGVVRLKVIEAHIGKVIVENNKFFDAANIRRSLPGLREGETPNIPDISASIKLANENPAKKITMQLKNAEKDGEIDATVNVVDSKPWSVGLNLDNSGNEQTGETHVGVLYKNANLGGADHVATLQYVTSVEKPENVHIYSIGYHVPLYVQADSMDFFGSYSNVDSGAAIVAIPDLQLSGKGTMFGMRYNHNLMRRKNYESTLIYGLDYRTYRNNLSYLGYQLGNDISVHPLSLTYSGAFTAPSMETNYYLMLVHNLPGGTRGSTADFAHQRQDSAGNGASPSYSALRFGAGHNYRFVSDWQMRLSVNGQYSRDMLVPGEQFGAGGANSVRGFFEREVAGDSGYLLNSEIYTPNLCSRFQAGSSQCRVLAFFDGASVYHNHYLSGEDDHPTVASMGLGLRLTMDKYLIVQMDYAQVVSGGGSRVKGDQRLHFSAGITY